MKSGLSLLCLALLVALAGCSGGPAASGTTDTSTSTTTVPTTDATTTGSPTTTVPGPPVHSYETLHDSGAVVRSAIENGSVAVTKGQLTGVLSPPSGIVSVRYQGTVYDVSWEREGLMATYELGRVPTVEPSEVDDSSAVVSYSELSGRAQQMFTDARTGNETRRYAKNDFPERFQSSDFVTYRDAYYRVVVFTSEHARYQVTATETRK
jgi:hypothetical protein